MFSTYHLSRLKMCSWDSRSSPSIFFFCFSSVSWRGRGVLSPFSPLLFLLYCICWCVLLFEHSADEAAIKCGNWTWLPPFSPSRSLVLFFVFFCPLSQAYSSFLLSAASCSFLSLFFNNDGTRVDHFHSPWLFYVTVHAAEVRARHVLLLRLFVH